MDCAMPSTRATADALLAVEHLDVSFATPDGTVRAVQDVDFSVAPGEALGIVGESGAGKSQLVLALMGLLAANGETAGSVRFQGRQLLGLGRRELDQIRGAAITMIFQDPMTALNPYLRIAAQLVEVLTLHRGLSAAEARVEAIAMLGRVGIPEPERRIDLFPHELSGGMRQRAMIAMALLGVPALLIADEPTTALDVTIQAQILDLIAGLRRDTGAAILLITHDLGVVAGLCDRVAVMYAGRIVESGNVRDIFYRPRHPYTLGLLRSMPRIDGVADELAAIPGQPPNAQRLPSGCAFRPRCAHRLPVCTETVPPLRQCGDGARVACHWEGVPQERAP
jgi:oligopeptide transport system ATP-binding protein